MTDAERHGFRQALTDGAGALGIALDEAQIALCLRHALLVRQTNVHLNLTRITEPEAMAFKHVLDSLTVSLAVPDLPPGARIADIGSGAGYPGIPLAIVRPDCRVTLIDSLRKRVTFLNEAIAALGLENITARHERVEEGREAFDLVLARAVAPLVRLVPWCAPRIAPGGAFVALKGGDVDDELTAAQKVLDSSRLTLTHRLGLTLPDPDASRRTLLAFRRPTNPGPLPCSSPKPRRTRKRVPGLRGMGEGERG